MESTVNTLRIILNGELVECSDFDPHTTVLDFLREQRALTGTKEGCAEGDCGACTVVLGELTQDSERRDRLALAPINACIRLLATLNSKALFTVESLKAASGALHPVQQAMIDCHGSQCGFCTPGFVMTLFALFKNKDTPSRKEINAALSGNLCRCTGYRPIIAAAQQMYACVDACKENRSTATVEQWRFLPATASDNPLPGELELVAKLQALQQSVTLEITSVQGHFIAPRTTAELSTRIAQRPSAWVLSGGTDIGLWITKALQTNDTILYTGDVDELKLVQETAEGVRIGAAVSLERAFQVLNQHYPELAHLWARFASWPIRSSGTLGGNVANGSPIGDSMPALITLAAQVILRKGAAQRMLPLESLYIDYKKQAREPGEWVEALIVPRRPVVIDGSFYLASYKNSKRNEQDIAAVCTAIAVRLQQQKVISCRIAYGGMAATSKRATQAEATLLGQTWSETHVQTAMQALDKDFSPLSDMRASADYRVTVAKNHLLRFWHETQAKSETVRLF